jgi:hypothetical protein
MQPDFLDQLRRKLMELGCPAVQMRRLVREVADHREDLKQAAASEGLSDADAEIRVNANLGNPSTLAEHQMTMLRQSSWWGRHFFMGFCALPLLVVPVLWSLLLVLDLSLGFALGYGWDEKKLHVAANDPIAFKHMVIALNGADFLAIALVALLFCWLARRAAVSFKWMLLSCGICSLYALFSWVHINPDSFALGIISPIPHGLSPSAQWIRAAIPLLIAGAIYISHRRTVRLIPATN